MSLEARLTEIEAALVDADAILSTEIGGHTEITQVRLRNGDVLVDWELDPHAGGCLLRPELLRRLLALGARATESAARVTLTASGRMVSSLTPRHAALVRHLGGLRRVELVATLEFRDSTYIGGAESYYVGSRTPVLRVAATVTTRTASPRTSPAPR